MSTLTTYFSCYRMEIKGVEMARRKTKGKIRTRRTKTVKARIEILKRKKKKWLQLVLNCFLHLCTLTNHIVGTFWTKMLRSLCML